MVVAQICQTVGWHSINSTPLEFMVDLMQEYIFQLSKLTQNYAQVCKCFIFLVFLIDLIVVNINFRNILKNINKFFFIYDLINYFIAY